MELAVLWNVQEVFQQIGEEEPVVRMKAELSSRPADETVVERVALGQIVQVSLERRRSALSETLLDSLRDIALEIATNPLMGDSMVANFALLVDGDGRRALDERLEMLDARFGGSLKFRCVGPLPPYSFATVEVQVPSFEEVDAARRRLCLGETATAAEIRLAYHRLARLTHPDHNLDDPDAEAEMSEMTQAYRLLTAYAESQALAPEFGNGGACHFDGTAVEETLLIAIRRQETPFV